MDIAIIGGGLTGLTAAYELIKKGHHVTVFEKEKTLGGLAGGFRPASRRGADASRGGQSGWNWSLEKYYHHFFTNDKTIISLAKELGLQNDIIIKRPVTATLCQKTENRKQKTEKERGILKNLNCIFQLDSPLNLLTFPLLSPIDKVRTAGLLAFCKLNPFWQPLEKITAKQLFKTIGGSASWRTLWHPLMTGKFGTYADHVPASWLWARIKKRTSRLGYFRAGFQTFVDRLATEIKKQGGTIITDRSIQSIQIKSTNKKNLAFSICHLSFDKVLITTPSSVATKLIKFPKLYESKLRAIPHLWAQTLILETKEPILPKTYWLNVSDLSFPFVAVVAHTNFMDKKYYAGHHITYIGNYLPDNHPYLKMTKRQLLKTFLPYLKKINQQFNNETIQQSHLFTSANAQPVHTINYSKKAPEMKTPIEGIYLANLDSIYPWDRGTNYAVELGRNAAVCIRKS